MRSLASSRNATLDDATTTRIEVLMEGLGKVQETILEDDTYHVIEKESPGVVGGIPVRKLPAI